MDHIFQYITIFFIFEIKYVKKKEKRFICLTVYYPPVLVLDSSVGKSTSMES